MNRKKMKAVAERLEGLPAQEQNVLDWLVDRASKEPVELSDSELEAAFGGQGLAGSLGFEDEAKSLEVKWSLSF